ncbi:MAG: hypothetical protein JKX67_06740 [Colwellia sp.]|nr:hypothetical protein [Colwellia sp.]
MKATIVGMMCEKDFIGKLLSCFSFGKSLFFVNEFFARGAAKLSIKLLLLTIKIAANILAVMPNL